MKGKQLLLVLLIVTLLIIGVQPQGRMLDPPSRMSAWRLGFSVPVNYNDNIMNCGSIQNQWGRNGGKCGICGESWSDVKLYERPDGQLVQHNIITKIYYENSMISVVIELTNNQRGWFEFRICDVAYSGGVEATQSCLNRTVLADREGNRRFLIPQGVKGRFDYSLVLPTDFICSHCVLQWKWKTGSSWGCDSTGCGIGRGLVQEEYYACADVAIAPRRGFTDIFSPYDFLTRPSPNANTSTNVISAISFTTLPSNVKTTIPIGTKNPCDGKPANLTSLGVRIEFQKMVLGLPNNYKNGCKIPGASTTANPLMASQCVINKDAVDRMCFVCDTTCQFEACYVLCPLQCVMKN